MPAQIIPLNLNIAVTLPPNLIFQHFDTQMLMSLIIGSAKRTLVGIMSYVIYALFYFLKSEKF